MSDAVPVAVLAVLAAAAARPIARWLDRRDEAARARRRGDAWSPAGMDEVAAFLRGEQRPPGPGGLGEQR